MITPPDPLLAARLDLALLQSNVLAAHVVADRMLDRDWQLISPRLVADLVDADTLLDTIRLAAEAIGVQIPTPWQAAKLAFDWLAYLLVKGRITAENAVRVRVQPNWQDWRDRIGATEELPSEPILAMMSCMYWWMDDVTDLSPLQYEQLLRETSAQLLATSRAVVAAPDWSFREWPETALLDPVLLAAVQ